MTDRAVATSRLVVSTWKNGNHSYTLDRERVPGVTTATGVLDKPALVGSAAKEAAIWAANNPDQLQTLGWEAFVRQAAAAPRDKWNQAADLGRDVHRDAQRLLETGEADVPPERLALVQQAADFLDTMVEDVVAVERPVFHEVFRYAGRVDLLGSLRGIDGISLCDFKTGASGIWPEHVLQQAGYRFASHLADPDEPMPPIAHVFAVWVRPEGWQLVPLKADREAWTTFLACLPLVQFRKQKDDDIIGAPVASGKADQ